MEKNFIERQGSVMKHGVCKGSAAPVPKTVIRKETIVRKTGIVKK